MCMFVSMVMVPGCVCPYVCVTCCVACVASGKQVFWLRVSLREQQKEEVMSAPGLREISRDALPRTEAGSTDTQHSDTAETHSTTTQHNDTADRHSHARPVRVAYPAI